MVHLWPRHGACLAVLQHSLLPVVLAAYWGCVWVKRTSGFPAVIAQLPSCWLWVAIVFFPCKIRALLLLASFPSAAAAAHQAPMRSCNRTWKTSFPLAVNTLSSKEISNWVMDGLLACQRALLCKIANIWKVIPGKYFYISMAGQIQPFQAFRHTLSSCSTWPRPEGWFWQAHKDFLGNLGIASSFISTSGFLPPPRPLVSA